MPTITSVYPLNLTYGCPLSLSYHESVGDYLVGLLGSILFFTEIIGFRVSYYWFYRSKVTFVDNVVLGVVSEYLLLPSVRYLCV